MLEGLKKTSLKWIKGLALDYRHFYWQRGYGAFSVSTSQLDADLPIDYRNVNTVIVYLKSSNSELSIARESIFLFGVAIFARKAAGIDIGRALG